QNKEKQQNQSNKQNNAQENTMPKSPAVELANKPKLEANTQNASQKTEPTPAAVKQPEVKQSETK
ncbi:MAG: hypothetical protein HN441_01460, partial [Candidatus Thioglobus sp.]|nr:hypothetical protein [Candidatus Thioglobus sp.]